MSTKIVKKLLATDVTDFIQERADNAQATAEAYADQKVADLVNGAPAILDTLNELAAAINNDGSFAATIAGQIGAANADIDALEGRMTTAEGDINALESDMATAQGDILSLEGRMTTAEGDIVSLEGRMLTAEGDIDSLEGRMLTAEGDIDALEGRMSIAEGDIDALEGRMTTAEGDINNLELEDLTFVKLDGTRAMTGSLDMGSHVVSNVMDPVGLQDAATKSYVDSEVAGVSGDLSALDARVTTAEGDIDALEGRMTTAEGDINALEGRMLTAEGDIDALEVRMTAAELDIDNLQSDMLAAQGDITDLQAEDLTFLKLDGSRPMTGALDMNSHLISDVLDPAGPQDAATKAYVDNKVAGLSWKQAAHVASVANVDIASAPASIDGHALSSQQRILLKDQTDASENGIYVFDSAGMALYRSEDADTWNEIVGAVLYIEQGLTNAGAKFVNTNISGGSLGVDDVNFTMFAAANALDGVGDVGHVAFWSESHTLTSEAHLSQERGGFGADVSAFDGVVKASGGFFSASTIVDSDVDSVAAIAYSKLAALGGATDAVLVQNASGFVSSSALVLSDVATKTYVDNAVAGKDEASEIAFAPAGDVSATNVQDAIEELELDYKAYADQAEADAIASANSYTDAREVAITSAYQAYADQAELDAIASANAYTDAAVAGKDQASEIAFTPAGDIAATDVQAAIEELELDYKAYADQAELDAIASANAYTDAAVAGKDQASEIAFTPAGNIAASDVQAAIEELDAEKLALAGGTMSGDIDMGGNVISGLGSPILSDDAATKAYVDSASSAAVSDAAYNEATWNGVTTIAPSKNAVRDEIEALRASVNAAALVGVKSARTLDGDDIAHQYYDLAHEVHADTLIVVFRGLVLEQGPSGGPNADYSVSTVGGVTRITFEGDFAGGNTLTPGSSALVSGDRLRFQYLRPQGV